MVTDDLCLKTMEGEVEVGKTATQKLISSEQFYTKHFTPKGRPFFIFEEIGDFVKGILLGRARDNSHINRTKSYQIEVIEVRQHSKDLEIEDGQIEEFFINRQLQRCIKSHNLANKLVRIVFVGRVKSGFGGHSAKVYRVFVDKGIFSAKESECNERGKSKPKNRKKSVTGKRKSTTTAAGR